MNRDEVQDKLVAVLASLAGEYMVTFMNRLVKSENAEQFRDEVSVYTSVITSMYTDIILSVVTDGSEEEMHKFMQEVTEKLLHHPDIKTTVSPTKEKLH